jgi:monothiol glutaredoxin
MALSSEMNDRLTQLVRSNKVVLFMKGNRHFPQCGFSAQVIQILDSIGARGYETFNVLSDSGVREAMKEFSQWPTFPQLYVNGELVGGCDIVKEMHASGELQKLLGVEAQPVKLPAIALSDSAAKAFREASEEAAGDVLHLEIDARFQNDLFFAPKKAGDIVVQSSGITICLDPASASRADGMSIDFVQSNDGAGFKITNPNEPPHVKPLRAPELKAMLDKGEVELFDVRPETERARAKIDAAKPLSDPSVQAYLEGLPKDRAIAFHCHHGIRSRNAGESLLREGFTNVYNLEGGIAAWSAEVDPKVPRY